MTAFRVENPRGAARSNIDCGRQFMHVGFFPFFAISLTGHGDSAPSSLGKIKNESLSFVKLKHRRSVNISFFDKLGQKLSRENPRKGFVVHGVSQRFTTVARQRTGGEFDSQSEREACWNTVERPSHECEHQRVRGAEMAAAAF